MIMAEDEIIHMMGRSELFRKFHKRLVSTSEFIFLVMCQPVVLRPSVAQAEGDARMEHAEKELCDLAVEHSAQDSVAEWNRS